MISLSNAKRQLRRQFDQILDAKIEVSVRRRAFVCIGPCQTTQKKKSQDQRVHRCSNAITLVFVLVFLIRTNRGFPNAGNCTVQKKTHTPIQRSSISKNLLFGDQNENGDGACAGIGRLKRIADCFSQWTHCKLYPTDCCRKLNNANFLAHFSNTDIMVINNTRHKTSLI